MEEIEEIMQESPDMEDESQTLPPELSMLTHPGSSCLLREYHHSVCVCVLQQPVLPLNINTFPASYPWECGMHRIVT